MRWVISFICLLALAPQPLLADGTYAQVHYEAGEVTPKMLLGVNYVLWIPAGVKQLRGIIIHQHGCGDGASIGAKTAAYDLHWQALARMWDCALLGPEYDQSKIQTCIEWYEPRNGSGETLQRGLHDLGVKTNHPELDTVPWCLWGHSGGGYWATLNLALHPERAVAVFARSGTASNTWKTGRIAPVDLLNPDLYRVPLMLTPGIQEKTAKSDDTGPWQASMNMHLAWRQKAGLSSFACDPKSGHDCGASRYIAIPYFDACLAARLPDPDSADRTLKPLDIKQGWLADFEGNHAAPYADYQENLDEACWLPTEEVAKKYCEYVKTAWVTDTTPPPAPFDLKIATDEKNLTLTWDTHADLESGLAGFIIERDGQQIAKLPEKILVPSDRPLFQTMSYHDGPTRPLAEMKFTEPRPTSPATYTVQAINAQGLKSAAASVTYSSK